MENSTTRRDNAILRRLIYLAVVLSFAGSVDLAAQRDDRFFKIQVIDRETRRGVPLVELRRVDKVRHYTDSNGIVAIDEPGLVGTDIYFHVSSHGYEFRKDGFGYRGRRLRITAGGEATLEVERTNIAQRLYRVTGNGIYRDSLLVGDSAPTRQPLINGRVFGSDSVVNAVYKGKIYWFWGDTNKPEYPLGNFHVPGAISQLPGKGGLDPSSGVNLEYFLGKQGFAKPTAEMPGRGPTWINGLTVVEGQDGSQNMFAMYVKVKPPLTIYRRGLVVFDDETEQFTHLREYKEHELMPYGHPFPHSVNGQDYIYYGNPLPQVRVPATLAAVRDPAQYEAYNCLAIGSSADELKVQRDDTGTLVYSWKRAGLRLTSQRIQQLIKSNQIKASESPLRLADANSDKAVQIHSGSINWNPYRKRWIMIGLETFGSSLLGEVWYAEAEIPEGPWSAAVKIVTHDKYSFYNPKQHPMFDQRGGQLIYFEGTYTHTFSGNPDQTPRYDYNQIMYMLDLSDQRLHSQP
jgi:hypothetical protein